jgi:hypothetical protein
MIIADGKGGLMSGLPLRERERTNPAEIAVTLPLFRFRLATAKPYGVLSRREEWTLEAESKNRYFEFCTTLGETTVPLIGSALRNALEAFGFEEEDCVKAAEVVTACCEEIAKTASDESCNFTCRFQRNGASGTFTVSTDSCSADLGAMATAIDSSPAWNSIIEDIAYNVETSTIVIAVKLGDGN